MSGYRTVGGGCAQCEEELQSASQISHLRRCKWDMRRRNTIPIVAMDKGTTSPMIAGSVFHGTYSPLLICCCLSLPITLFSEMCDYGCCDLHDSC